MNRPIEVESAPWSEGGQLDWWVRELGSGSAGSAVQVVVKSGSGLLSSAPGQEDVINQKAVTMTPADVLIASC